MKEFSTLVHALDSTNKTSVKSEAIGSFLGTAEDKDKLWLLALFTGKRPKRRVPTKLMSAWAMELSGIPEWLFRESYAVVGDLAETISLILPPATHKIDKSLSHWMQDIIQLENQSDEAKKNFVLQAWSGLGHTERFIFNKLLGGSFRLGISSQGMINAIAKHFDLESTAVAHAIMGDWQIGEIAFDDLIHGTYTDTQLSKPYPFCLAYALEKEPESLGDITHWQAEYKWDGIRGQLIKRQDQLFIWSRGEELVTDQFPELGTAARKLPDNFVIDGEILAYKEGKILDFSVLQRRLNRKNVSRKLLDEVPVGFFAYDLLEWEQEDWRGKPLESRRKKLETLLSSNRSDCLRLSMVVKAQDWASLSRVQQDARAKQSEGLMLKHLDSPYHTGRKKGDWWKWKVDPMTIDAVLIYAQKGSGRRSGHYTDYTFAVRHQGELISIAKAYSGLTDKEIQEVSRFVTKNALEKFGPVRTVKPELVFEIAFEGIGYSPRHKSGVALRFPRIKRWRRDKTVEEIDELEDIKKLIG